MKGQDRASENQVTTRSRKEAAVQTSLVAMLTKHFISAITAVVAVEGGHTQSIMVRAEYFNTH